MKTKIKNNLVHVACLLLVLGFVARAFALMGEITEPGLALPPEFPAATRTKLMTSLQRSDCKFLGGTFFNDRTFLKYGGDTKSLNLFLESLSQCPGLTLSIRFYNYDDEEKFDWAVEHEGRVNSSGVCVRVNLKSSHLKLEDLVVPDTKGPSLPKKTR